MYYVVVIVAGINILVLVLIAGDSISFFIIHVMAYAFLYGALVAGYFPH